MVPLSPPAPQTYSSRASRSTHLQHPGDLTLPSPLASSQCSFLVLLAAPDPVGPPSLAGGPPPQECSVGWAPGPCPLAPRPLSCSCPGCSVCSPVQSCTCQEVPRNLQTHSCLQVLPSNHPCSISPQRPDEASLICPPAPRGSHPGLRHALHSSTQVWLCLRTPNQTLPPSLPRLSAWGQHSGLLTGPLSHTFLCSPLSGRMTC